MFCVIVLNTLQCLLMIIDRMYELQFCIGIEVNTRYFLNSRKMIQTIALIPAPTTAQSIRKNVIGFFACVIRSNILWKLSAFDVPEAMCTKSEPDMHAAKEDMIRAKLGLKCS